MRVNIIFTIIKLVNAMPLTNNAKFKAIVWLRKVAK